MITTVISFLSFLFLFGYYVYLADHLNQAEVIFLSLKERYRYALVLPILTIICLTFLTIEFLISLFNNDVDMIYSFLVFILCNILLLFLGLFLIYRHPINVYAKLYNTDYQIRYKVADLYFSASVLKGRDNKTFILPISKLENVYLYTKQERNSSRLEVFLKLFVLSLLLTMLVSIPLFWFREWINWFWRLGILAFIASASLIIMIKKIPDII